MSAFGGREVNCKLTDKVPFSAVHALIADDHDVYRAGLHSVLKVSGHLSQIAEASCFDEALDRLAAEPVELAIFDLDMPGMNGPGTLRQVRMIYPNVTLIIVSACSDRTTITAALSTGIDAYITKATGLPAMVKIIWDTHALRQRQSQHEDTITDRRNVVADRSARLFGRAHSITRRQSEVLKCVVRGMSNKEIARELKIAPGTVKIHIAGLFAFYQVRNRTELVSKTHGAT